ncbi:quinone oxidoreductase [Tistrella bauzanensis]|uniref:Quinone oxidoreductase n=1 Tax=Tistrella bauzanensis TaxID=657419 RepID=A0ABQ1IPC4_9PROT|nr:quinone oxidoreductase [Tistrella bauzanensis]GGB46556.1 quinone oxidoreductase [Tistrella bauzanensis]
MVKAIRIEKTGGPEVMAYVDVEVAAPGPGQIRIRHTAVGLNFIDVYFRTGLYALPALPAVLGMEGAGEVVAVGDGVDDLKPGDRVAYASGPVGSYAEERLIAADRVVPVPDTIDDVTAASMMLKGMTAQYLLRRTYPVQAGQTILIHAAAGGVGQIACQWAKALGATVIGTVGSAEKAELARANGCDHTVLYREENLAERVRALTDGKGVPVVYDSVGKDTFMASLDCLQTRGYMVSFGQSSGSVGPVDLVVLNQRGGLYVTRPSLIHYTGTKQELRDTARDLFDVVTSGKVKVGAARTYPLAEAAQAHRDLEARATTGATVLIP